MRCAGLPRVACVCLTRLMQVYDYVDAFEGAVISEADHCLVVELRAWGGLAIAGGEAATGALGEGAPQVSLFSGLVGSDPMQAAFRRVSRFGGGRAERVVMAGPGGRGRVEVAVTEPAEERGLVRRVMERGGAPGALQCCVMSVCMPWDLLARDVLFKPPQS